MYRPPDYSLPSFLSNLESLLDELEIMDSHPMIVCGDLNENLLSNASKPILDMFTSRRYAQLITAAQRQKRTHCWTSFSPESPLWCNENVLQLSRSCILCLLDLYKEVRCILQKKYLHYYRLKLILAK